MVIIRFDGHSANIQLTEDDVKTIEKYARREEITPKEALQEACNNGIEEIAFNKG